MAGGSVALAVSGGGGGGATSLVKAYLRKITPSASGGGGDLGTIRFQFNPKEFTVAKQAKWERKSARGAKTATMPEFTGADASKLTLEVFFDATDKPDGSVVADVEDLFSCCVPLEETQAQKKPSPPWVVFGWGSVVAFVACVTSVSAKYSLFRPDGTPIRATCSVTLEEIPGVDRPQNPTSGGLPARRMHTLVAGDTLPSVAYREYGDPTRWRVLAEANGIDDPLRLASGRPLRIPSPEEVRV